MGEGEAAMAMKGNMQRRTSLWRQREGEMYTWRGGVRTRGQRNGACGREGQEWITTRVETSSYARRRRSCKSVAKAGTVDDSALEMKERQLKNRMLTIAAMTDRGQLLFKEKVYGLQEYNDEKEKEMKEMVKELCESRSNSVNNMEAHNGTFELVFATKQLFRASPFFMAISESMEGSTWHAPWSNEDTAVPSGELFFRLHELQVMSWGASTVGKVTQTIDTNEKTISSTFDTILFRLTVIPVIGWFKLLPTFGGRVSSFARYLEINASDRIANMSFELEKTRVDEVEGIPRPPFFLRFLLGIEWPVSAIWNVLPWNKSPPTCSTDVVYLDEPGSSETQLRICKDKDDEIFVYVRCP